MTTSVPTCERFFASCRGSYAVDVRRDKMFECAIFMMAVEEEFSCDICGELFCFDCPSFRDEICLEPEEKEPIGTCAVVIEDEHDGELFEDDHDDSSEDDPLLKLSKVSKEKLIDGLFSYELKLETRAHVGKVATSATHTTNLISSKPSPTRFMPHVVIGKRITRR